MPQTPQPPKPYTLADSTPLAPPQDPFASLTAALRGHYEFERELGQGAFATVYLARDLKHERKVAIKVLRADPNSEMGELRFVREIRMLARLQHPNILPLHDSGHVENLLYYVMPYVSGETLRDRLRAERQLPWEAACNIARDVADALAYAHAQGIIHRDIKPENILLSAGHPMLADFGIARAIDVAGVKQLTRPDVGSPGTPAYMSPEQLIGIGEIDSRSDIYSLGCVLFEMITGVLPFPGEDGLVNRFTEPVPSAAGGNESLPDWVDGTLRRALQREPKARFATATDFASALCGPSGGVRASSTRSVSSALLQGATSSPGEERTGLIGTWIGNLLTRVWNRRILGPTAALIALAAVIAPPAIKSIRARDNVDSERFIIISPSGFGGAQSNSRPDPAQKLYDALSAWRGLPLVSDAAVEEAARTDGAPETLRDAFRVAKQLGAGNVIWIRDGSSSVRGVKAELFDVLHKTSTGRFVILNDSSSTGDYASAALNLAGMSNRSRLADGGDDLTHSFAAWTAYNRGHLALAKWDLAEASRQFASAVAYDASFAPAQTWLAQIGAWADPTNETDWGAQARKAASDERLHERDRLISQALVALADHRLDEACALYRRLSATAGAEFLGLYGLGECQSSDSLVLRSSRGATRWHFRSSYQAAANAYIRALNLEPRAHSIFPFARLQTLLPTSATRVRVGQGAAPQPQTFLAYPALEPNGDTVGFTPYPLRDFANLSPSALATQNAALERNTEILAAFTSAWTRQLPSDPKAFAARAEVLEISGDIAGEPFEQTAVMRAIGQVRALSKDPQAIFETRVKEAWLRFKRQEFEAARTIADSLLRALPNPRPTEAEALLPLAALTGKLDRTVALGRSVYPFLPVSGDALPVQVRDAASALLINSGLGVCGAPIDRLEQQLQQALVRYVPKERANVLRDELMDRPRSLLVPCTNGQSALRIAEPRMRLYQIQQAFAQGNVRKTRQLLDSASRLASSGRPGDKSVDFTYQEAWIHAAMGDTAIAIQLLDNVLDALPSLSPDNVQALGSASALGQAMILRARLAGARGDLRTAKYWGRAASQLWATADPIVRAVGHDVWTFAN